MGYPLSSSPCWAPGWVGSTPDEIILYLMATPKSSKRSYSDSESDTETQQSSFPHFIVLESIEDKPMSKLSPFIIEKTLSGLFTPVSVKKLGNGTLLVEVNKKPYADILLKIKSFGGLKIKAFAHLSLNTSKGVVRSSELSLCTLDELKSHLANQGVTDIKRISIKRNEETINTNTYILTFNKSSLPKEHTDLKPHINSFIANKWQERWSFCLDNKLFKIKPTLGVWPSGFRNSRKEEVVLSRLRIGHTYFSHSYILRQEDPPECTACQEIYSVRHVLIDCIDLGLIRPRFYTVQDMKTLFDTVSVDRILSFVKEVDLFTKI